MNIQLTNLLDLQGVQVESEGISEEAIVFNLIVSAKAMYCPHSHYTEELHQVRPILVRDLAAFGKPVYLNLPRRQFYCRICQRYFTEHLNFIDYRRKYTQRYEVSIYSQVNNLGIEQVSQQEKLNIEQVKNIFNHVQQKHKSKSAINTLAFASFT
ncbi:transposase family protein, partial [Nostoc sp. NIES-2111]